MIALPNPKVQYSFFWSFHGFAISDFEWPAATGA
jgi:hypothetical protein